MIKIERMVSLYRDNRLKVWMLLLLGLPSFLLIGSLLMPDLFWDGFLWRYFWGPVVADAEGRDVNGISAGYNPINTTVYGLGLVVAFFGVYELIRHFDLKIDRNFVYSLLPWVILGGSLRSLEDAGLFKDPIDKFMITPLIYFVLGISAISLLIVGSWLSKIDLKENKKRVSRLLLLLPIPTVYLFTANILEYYNILFLLVILCGISLCFFLAPRFFHSYEKYLLFSYGSVTLLLTLSYNLYYIVELPHTNPLEVVLIPGAASALTLAFLTLLWSFDRLSQGSKNVRSFGVFFRSLNVLIFFAHLFDASSTYRGITAYGYAEKHVIPELLIDITGTPLVVFPIKLIMVVLIVYVLDVYMREEYQDKKMLVNLLKLVVIILGAAPGVRNTLRLAMGV